MNWSAVAAIISGMTLLIVLIGGGSMWGKLVQKVADNTREIASCKTDFEELDRRVGTHDVDIARLQEWKDGYNAAARVGGRTSEV